MPTRLLGLVVTAAILVGAACGGSSATTQEELVATLLSSSDPPERAEAARELAATPDPAAVRAVARSQAAVKLLRDSLVDVYRSPATTPRTRIDVIRAIAAADDQASAAVVARALARDRSAAVRGAAAKALGRMSAAKSVVPSLMTARFRGTRGSRQIEEALVLIGSPAVDKLLPELAEAPWARRVIARIGKPVLPLLRRALDRGSFERKVDAGYGLLDVGIPRDVRRVVSEMMDVLAGRNDSHRFTAIAVLAAAGRPAVDAIVPVLRRPYDSLNAVEKKQWEWGIQLLVDTTKANPKATRHLFRALSAKDYDLVADLHAFFIRMGRPGTEAGLIAALNASGDTIMALDFLNSGNAKLDRGARAWAASRGYTITEGPGEPVPGTWGSR